MRIYWLGELPYSTASALQAELAQARMQGAVGDTLLLLTHPPTITMGRAATDEHVLVSADELAKRGLELHRINRGGDVTYHGPGQLVGYPILDLSARGSDIHAYLRALEQVIIDALATFDISAGRMPAMTGVWVGERKIAAIGVAVRRWVTSHGFALNVTADLDGFRLIVPCGIRDYGVTSVSVETGRSVSPVHLLTPIARSFSRVFADTEGTCPPLSALSTTTAEMLYEGIDLTDPGVLDWQALGR